MTIERAASRPVRKPWGCLDPWPWSQRSADGAKVGELWFQRSGDKASESILLLKLLFSSAPLSIQVHPDDAFARSIGLERGKTEAWYVLSAESDAKIGLGLTRSVPQSDLQRAIGEGTIVDLIQWRNVKAGDAILVPARTIHAIGSGLVIAEIQQRSDVTFRLFDYGSDRELHIDMAVAAADAAPFVAQGRPRRLTDVRTQLVSCRYFTLERVDLEPDSEWMLNVDRETWALVLDGEAKIGQMTVVRGDVVFMEEDEVRVEVVNAGLKGLFAYVGSEAEANLLQRKGRRNAADFPSHKALASSASHGLTS